MIASQLAPELEYCNRNLNRLENWMERNLMKFIKGKCKVLHLGRNNLRHQYNWGLADRKIALTEKNFGILVDPLLCCWTTVSGVL